MGKSLVVLGAHSLLERRCRYWYPSGGGGAFTAGYFVYVVGQHRSESGGKSVGVSVAWLRLGEGF
jgi:hypothetical protein